MNEYTPTEADDVQTWPVLEPMSPHLMAIIHFADGSGIAEPNTRLLSVMGGLLHAKAQYQEAEPLMRRALAIDEQSFGTDHPNVARDLNNLALLLKATDRLGEAEPLMRRALAIFVASLGADHPSSQMVAENFRRLLEEMHSAS